MFLHVNSCTNQQLAIPVDSKPETENPSELLSSLLALAQEGAAVASHSPVVVRKIGAEKSRFGPCPFFVRMKRVSDRARNSHPSFGVLPMTEAESADSIFGNRSARTVVKKAA